MADNADKVPADAKANVDGPLEELKKAIADNDLPAMREATEKVAQASQALGSAMYEATAAADAAAGGDAQADNDDDVVDAEIVEEDETK